jgi:hypothetical protein
MLSITHPLQLVPGLIIWALWFIAIYGGLSVACALAPPNAITLLLTDGIPPVRAGWPVHQHC